MKLKPLLITTIGTFAIANLYAGDTAVTPDAKAVVEEPADYAGSMTLGYDTSYILRGVNYGDNQVTAQIDYDIPNTPLAIGAWYGNPTTGRGQNPAHLDELDLYATLSHSFGSIDAWLGHTAYLYPEGGGNTNEIGTGVGTALGPIDLALAAYYDFDIAGWYIDLTVGHSFAICDSTSLDLAAGISYSVDYNSADSDFNSVLLMASLPIKLTDRATLTPYVAGTFALEAIDSYQDDQIFGGISLRVAF